MDLCEAIEIICNDYCKYPDIESGNKLADICDKCPMNKCEDLRWADFKTESDSEKPNNSTSSKMEQVDKDINVRSKDEQTDCTEALTLLWIKNMVTDEEFYRIDARLKVMSQTERSE